MFYLQHPDPVPDHKPPAPNSKAQQVTKNLLRLAGASDAAVSACIVGVAAINIEHSAGCTQVKSIEMDAYNQVTKEMGMMSGEESQQLMEIHNRLLNEPPNLHFTSGEWNRKPRACQCAVLCACVVLLALWNLRVRG